MPKNEKALRGTPIRKSTGDRIADALIYLLLALMTVAVLFPFYNMLLISVAKYEDIISTPLYLFPKSIDLQNYRMAFLYPNFLRSAGVSLFVTLVGTALNLLMTLLGAYVLSRRALPFRKFFFYLVVFTMYFGGGLIPWYMVVKTLGFVDSVWAMIIPPAMNTFYLILMRNYFQNIPESLEDSAKIDGATSWQAFRYITLPLLAPFIMVAVIIRTIDALKAFDTIYVITQGGPGTASETINIFLYLNAFAYYNMGYASAVVVVFFALIIGLALLLLWSRERFKDQIR